jgi:hypothetical protein
MPCHHVSSCFRVSLSLFSSSSFSLSLSLSLSCSLCHLRLSFSMDLITKSCGRQRLALHMFGSDTLDTTANKGTPACRRFMRHCPWQPSCGCQQHVRYVKCPWSCQEPCRGPLSSAASLCRFVAVACMHAARTYSTARQMTARIVIRLVACKTKRHPVETFFAEP